MYNNTAQPFSVTSRINKFFVRDQTAYAISLTRWKLNKPLCQKSNLFLVRKSLLTVDLQLSEVFSRRVKHL